MSSFSQKTFSLKKVYDLAEKKGRLYGLIHKGNFSFKNLIELSVDPLSAIIISASSLYLTTFGKNFSNQSLPFQFRITTAVFIFLFCVSIFYATINNLMPLFLFVLPNAENSVLLLLLLLFLLNLLSTLQI